MQKGIFRKLVWAAPVRAAATSEDTSMGLFRADFYRFFTVGFVAGALLVVASVEGDIRSAIAEGIVPAAQAQTLSSE